ncbi:MAG: KpsF/GutQ family sugar-phosphate isomerase [Mesorhizobium sp.]|uniref:KpsF/GutQ family sugar-phosphate isomerase n=1 Tax=Mesorhizobium sp. TaxID=1871066 RepID=UPI00122632F2|nr:KpsF/GutQ family sugar-phosphate isomerase [Mesorhizobium sp.]TIR48684.1 MAG: KpsF/GutQ family sugar-phosphate isomerase [Mesorhizobium sp.]
MEEGDPTPALRFSRVSTSTTMLCRAREFLRAEAAALHHIAQRLDAQFCAVAEIILHTDGIVFITGIGKSRLVGEKISATLASTGTRSIALNPSDALHGDLGRLRNNDILLCLSNSGETEELVQLVVAAKRLGVTIIAMTGRAGSVLTRMSDLVLEVGPLREACPLGLAPTTTTTAQMAVGDALALVILEQRGFSADDFARFHPSGSLSKRISRIREVMRSGHALPTALKGTLIKEALLTMCSTPGRAGAVVVTDEKGTLLGLLTDRELQPIMAHTNDIFDTPIEAVMCKDPLTMGPDASVHAAIDLLQRTSREHAIIIDDFQCAIGLIARSDVFKRPRAADNTEAAMRSSRA